MALKIKKGYHPTITLDNIEYYVRSNGYGFGYEIMRKIPTPVNPDRKFYECYFRHKDKEIVKELFNSIAENEKLPETLPDVGDDKVPMTLRFDTKHHTYYYKVDTIEELEKVARHILKETFDEGRYYNPYNNKPDKNITGFNSKEEIEELPQGNVRRVALEEWDRYEKALKDQKGYEREWDNLQHVLSGKGVLGNVMRALDTYEQDYYRLEELTIVE